MPDLYYKVNDDFIRGLVVGEGCFTFSRTKGHDKNGNGINYKIPGFYIAMNIRDTQLLTEVRNYLGIKNKIYVHDSYQGDGIKRGPTARLIVREYNNLKNIIIPLFYKKLTGHKAIQFEKWLNDIGEDPLIPFYFKKLYWIYKAGFYDDYLKTGSLNSIKNLDL